MTDYIIALACIGLLIVLLIVGLPWIGPHLVRFAVAFGLTWLVIEVAVARINAAQAETRAGGQGP